MYDSAPMRRAVALPSASDTGRAPYSDSSISTYTNNNNNNNNNAGNVPNNSEFNGSRV